jgi:type I restriction enzyme S subunit
VSELPKGWILTKFGNVLFSLNSGLNGKQNKVGDGIPVSRIETIANQRIDMSRIGFLKDYDVDKIAKYRLHEGNILFSNINSPAHLGKTALCEKEVELYHGVNLLRLTVNEAIIPSLLNYYCKYIRGLGEFSARAQHAVNQSSLNQTKLKDFDIPLAPLNEQIRIADKLDSMLAKVDAAQVSLDKIPYILKRFRQSVLAAATSGELTEEWRKNNKTLWECDKFNVSEIANDEKYSLGIGPFGSNLKVADYKNEGHPLVFVRDIRGRSFGGHNTKFINLTKFEELKAHRVKPGNILITKMGDPPGDVAIYPNDRPEAVITSDCIKLDVNDDLVLKDYIFYYMQSDAFQIQIKEITAGVAQQKVNLKNFKALNLLVPGKVEQLEIVNQVEKLLAHADKVEKKYLKSKDHTNRLTQSILAKAFRGELVSQDEKDEPASELLARIKEQAKSIVPKKNTKK